MWVQVSPEATYLFQIFPGFPFTFELVDLFYNISSIVVLFNVLVNISSSFFIYIVAFPIKR